MNQAHRPHHPADTAARPRRRRRLLGCGGVLLVLLLIVAAILSGGYYQTTRNPAGWADATAPLASADPASLDQTAQSLEHRALAVTDIRGRAPWTFRLNWSEANIWLEQRLRPWAASQNIEVPAAVGRVAAWTEDQTIVIGVEVEAGDTRRVISLDVQTTLDDAGQVIVRLAGVRAGRLPLPADALLERLGLDDDPRFADLAPYLEQATTGIPLRPVHEIDPTRQVRITGITLDDEGVELTLVTEPRGERR